MISDIGRAISFPLLLGLLAAPSLASADPIAIFSTGVDASGNALPAGSVDPHWTVQTETYDNAGCLPCDGISASGGPFLTDYNGADYVGSTAYVGDTDDGLDTSSSAFIAWSPNNSGSYVPYTYRETFDLAGLDPTTAVIVLTVQSDDDDELALNGVLIPSTYEFRGTEATDTYTLDSGFLDGLNTLDVVAYNEGGAGGIIVTIDSATADPVPEPATLGLFGASIAAFGMVRRRAKRKAA